MRCVAAFRFTFARSLVRRRYDMGNKYMKANQSIDDLCKNQTKHQHHRLHHKHSSKSTEILSNKTPANRSGRLKFLTKSYRKKKPQIQSRPTTTDRVAINGQRFLFSKDSIFASNSDPDLNGNPKNLGFAIIREVLDKHDSLENAHHKYCYNISTSTPIMRRFNAIKEFERLYQRNINEYGSEISSISKMSLEFEDIQLNKAHVMNHSNKDLHKDKSLVEIDQEEDQVTQRRQPSESTCKMSEVKESVKDLDGTGLHSIANTQFSKLCRKMSLDIKMVPKKYEWLSNGYP